MSETYTTLYEAQEDKQNGIEERLDREHQAFLIIRFGMEESLEDTALKQKSPPFPKVTNTVELLL